MSVVRLQVILKTAINYGLIDLIPKKYRPWYFTFVRWSLFWIRNQHANTPAGERIRLALESLGPVFIKLGQMLSTRKDLIPPEIADQLAKLQDQVTPFDGGIAKQLIEQSLGISDIGALFNDFEIEPLASASIAQVHTATCKKTGQGVVLKVIRPNIEATIHADLELMFTLARLVSSVVKDAPRLRPVEVVNEYKKTLLDELDLANEAANCAQLKQNFNDSKLLYIPQIYPHYCRQNVLVMERIHGIPVADMEQLNRRNTDLKVLAERGVEVFFTQVFRDSFFHADMHPGNIFVDASNPKSPSYIAIDFGIVGTLNSQDKRYLAENFIAFFNRDYRKVAQLHIDSGWVPCNTNIDEFEIAIKTVCEPIFEKPLAEISFGLVLLQLFNTARRFNMVVQPQLVLLQKTLLYIEGLGRQLYPQLDLWKTAKPFLEDWVREQMGVQAMFKKVKNNLPFWAEKLPEIPELFYDGMQTIKQLPQLQQQTMESIQRHQQQTRKSWFFTTIAATVTLTSVILNLQLSNQWLVISSSLLCIFAWLLAWRHSR